MSWEPMTKPEKKPEKRDPIRRAEIVGLTGFALNAILQRPEYQQSAKQDTNGEQLPNNFDAVKEAVRAALLTQQHIDKQEGDGF